MHHTSDKVLVHVQRSLPISCPSAKLLFGYYWSLWAFVTEKTKGDRQIITNKLNIVARRHRHLAKKHSHRGWSRRFDGLRWRRVWWTVISLSFSPLHNIFPSFSLAVDEFLSFDVFCLFQCFSRPWVSLSLFFQLPDCPCLWADGWTCVSDCMFSKNQTEGKSWIGQDRLFRQCLR